MCFTLCRFKSRQVSILHYVSAKNTVSVPKPNPNGPNKAAAWSHQHVSYLVAGPKPGAIASDRNDQY